MSLVGNKQEVSFRVCLSIPYSVLWSYISGSSLNVGQSTVYPSNLLIVLYCQLQLIPLVLDHISSLKTNSRIGCAVNLGSGMVHSPSGLSHQ